jgi:hypothetical protein
MGILILNDILLCWKGQVPSNVTKALNRFLSYVRFQVLTAVAMKCSIFWDITPCSPVIVDV